jgi:hypothetical protein
MILLKDQTQLRYTVTRDYDTIVQTQEFLDHPISALLCKLPENFRWKDEVA